MPIVADVRVLVVDDERVIADTLALILNTNGYRAYTAYSGEDAIEMAVALKPDALISDVVMGGMTGIDVAIHFSNFLPQCKIILVSGNISTAGLLEIAGKQGHQFEVLPKPIHPQILMNQLCSPGT